MILIFRIVTTIPVPGVNTAIISSMVSGNNLLALYNMFTGGAFSNFTLFALGIGPYITASIIIQLLTVGFESLKELQKSPGNSGVVIYLKDVKAMKKLPAPYHVEIQDAWLLGMREKYGDSNVKVVERVLKNL